MLKKIAAMMMAVVMVLTLPACGTTGGNESSSSGSDAPSQNTPTTTLAPSQTESAPSTEKPDPIGGGESLGCLFFLVGEHKGNGFLYCRADRR